MKMEKTFADIAVVISPNWRDYAEKYLEECMESLRAQDYGGRIDIYITDNESSAESYALLRRLAPEARLVLNKGNDGFAKGCNDSIWSALSLQNYPYIYLVNMDTVLDVSCVREAVILAEEEQQAALIQSRIMIYGQDDVVNSLGNDSHFLGFGYCRGYKGKWSELKKDFKSKIMYPSGAGVLIRVSAIADVGLFDEKLWMYNEDQDLGWKSWLMGYENIIAETSVVYHKYEFAKSIKQYYYMDRNRIIVILKNYRLATLILIAPLFLVMEIGLILFSLRSGWFREKLRVWRYFFSWSSLAYIKRERQLIQKKRKRSDREIATLLSGKIWYQEIDDWKLRAINPIFNAYWHIVKMIIFW
jgi:GT2 family glycosyltransferase